LLVNLLSLSTPPSQEEIEPEEPEPEEEPLVITCYHRMSYSPASYRPLLFFGIVGGLGAVVSALLGYTSMGDDGTYMGAICLSIAVPYFVHGFTVQKTQSASSTVIKGIVALAGSVMGILTVVVYAQLSALDGMVGAVFWVLSTLFYLWVSLPLALIYWDQFKEWRDKSKKKKKKRKAHRNKTEIAKEVFRPPRPPPFPVLTGQVSSLPPY